MIAVVIKQNGIKTGPQDQIHWIKKKNKNKNDDNEIQ